ncbi:SMP-30/gluconolactonase/LRE family protein [Amycolatopsis mongoliensis]|uniref:SMP-30/gluconolactonase/LRE family protein n=1 Tax=Amycolatopsis mongoliensis TaxID=715475 RepID=A0A9Y2JTF9_9PSEU|nr:SMP-30/gluconolactonase/LRE family protein [Amycolatopsis sp. 4-36]WIY04406.1 SMP-30/gluconolactonase/LRE family protein [Amycolatopsis sp. 4-36]
MRRTVVLTATAALMAGLLSGASAGEVPPSRHPAVFETVFASPLGLEGLTTDSRGNLFTPARGADPCPVYRVAATGGPAAVVGTIPAPCTPAGLAFDRGGRLYVANADTVVSFVPDAANPPAATVFASGVPGANGLAFDRSGALWISDGVTGQGRVWRAGADGVAAEMFRVQPLVSDVNVVNGVGGVGRDVRGLPPGAVTITPNGRAAADTAGSQHIVANGLAFTADGTLLVADTARGALWRAPMDRAGRPRAATGCDVTFPANTLCLDDLEVQHPYLEGADGIVLDRAGTVWTAANERNAIVLARRDGRVVEYFRNPADATSKLRNGGPLEFPTSPVLLPDGRLCVTNSDGSRRDNAPNTAGEANPAGPVRAKISCVKP